MRHVGLDVGEGGLEIGRVGTEDAEDEGGQEIVRAGEVTGGEGGG